MRLKILAVPNTTQLYTEQEWEQFVSTIKCLQGLANFAEAYLRVNKVSELLEKTGLELQSLYEKTMNPSYSLSIQDLQPLNSLGDQFYEVTNHLIESIEYIFRTDLTPKFRSDSYSNRTVKTSFFIYDLTDKLAKLGLVENYQLITLFFSEFGQNEAKIWISKFFNEWNPYIITKYKAYLSLLKDIQSLSQVDTTINREGFETKALPERTYTEFLYPYIKIMGAKNLSV